MGRLGGFLLKALGLFVLVLVALAAIGTIVGIVFGIVATIVSLVFSLAVLAVFVLAAVGLFSLFRGGDGAERADDPWARLGDESRTGAGAGRDDRAPEERLRDRYVAGEIDEAEYERKLELLLGSSDVDDRLGGTESGSDRSLRDRLFE